MENIIRDGTNWGAEADKLNANFTEDSIKDTAFAVNVDPAMSGDVIVPDGDKNNFFDIYLNRPVTRIEMPINARNGEIYRFQIRQDGTGGRSIIWGTKVSNTGLTCTLNKGMGNTCLLYITAGTFDWTQLSKGSGRQSFITLNGFTQSALNLGGIKISDFDESAGYIQFDHPFIDSISDVTGDTGCTIDYENKFYFLDKDSDSWIGQQPYEVTQFTFFSTTGGASGLLTRKGIYSNSIVNRAKARSSYEIVDDFIAGNDDGQLQWAEANSEGAISTSSSDVDSNHFGIVYHRLNSGANSARTNMRLVADGFVLSESRSVIETVIKFDNNYFSETGNTVYIGWNDGNNTPTNAIDGYYFEVISNGDNTGRLWCITETGNTKDAYDTGIDLGEDDWQSFTIQMASGFGSVQFYVNDVLVQKKLNTGGTLFTEAKITPFFGSQYSGTGLVSTKSFYVDLFSLKYRMNADRI